MRESVVATMTNDYHIAVPSERKTGVMLDKVLIRARAVLAVAKEPLSAEDIFRRTSGIPISSLYHLLNSMVRLGWLRTFSRPTPHLSGNGKSMTLYVWTGEGYPRRCPGCGLTLYSAEMAKGHGGPRCR